MADDSTYVPAAPEDDKMPARLRDWLKAVTYRLNGFISRGSVWRNRERAGNLDEEEVDVITPAVANTEFSIVLTKLNRTPLGCWIVRQDKASVVYSTRSAERNVLHLKCDTATVTMRLLVF